MGTIDLDFHTVVGETFYTGLLITCFGTATILTIWIKIISRRCKLPNTNDIGIKATRNLDSILLNIFLVSLIIVNAILFNTYYKGYLFEFMFDLLLNPTNLDSGSQNYLIQLSEFQWKNLVSTLSGASSILVRYCNQC